MKYKIYLHPEDAFYKDRQLIDGKIFVRDTRPHGYLVPGFAYQFANAEDLQAWYDADHDSDHINIYNKSTVIDFYGETLKEKETLNPV